MKPISRSEIEILSRKINECRKHLHLGKIYACLLEFRELLEKSLKTPMLAADEKHIVDEINAFQRQLQNSKNFKDVFGPVTFQDNDRKTTLSFIEQLVVVEEEGILASQSSQISGTGQKTGRDDLEPLVQKIILLIDRGDIAKARNIYGENEQLRSLIVRQYNRAGIGYRREGRFDTAMAEFKKALMVEPEDEGLHYNMARVHIEQGDWAAAETLILTALKINAGFQEGQSLLEHIRRQQRKTG